MSTKVVTGKVRFSYVSVFAPKDFGKGQKPKYSTMLLIPKTDEKTIKKIKAAINEAIDAGVQEKWGGQKPKGLHMPLRDGDEEKDEPEYQGMYFINAKSDSRPGVVDKDVQPILDPEELYSGCWGRASIRFYAYDVSGNKGIGVGLDNIQKLRDDTRLGGGRATAESDFGDGYTDDDDDDDEDF